MKDEISVQKFHWKIYFNRNIHLLKFFLLLTRRWLRHRPSDVSLLIGALGIELENWQIFFEDLIASVDWIAWNRININFNIHENLCNWVPANWVPANWGIGNRISRDHFWETREIRNWSFGSGRRFIRVNFSVFTCPGISMLSNEHS